MVGKKTEKIDYKVNLELQICSIILNMKNPFSVYELLVRTDSQQIKNRDFVLDVLNQLCESGIVKYYEVQDNIWKYKIVNI